MSFAAPSESATHEQLGLVSAVRDAVDNDQENLQDRKSEISAGHGEQIEEGRTREEEEVLRLREEGEFGQRARNTVAPDDEEEDRLRLRDQLRKRSKEEEVIQQQDRLKKRFESSDPTSNTSRRTSSKARRSSRRMYTDRPFVEPLGPPGARPTVAIPTSPNVVSPGRRFDGPVAVSKTSQPAISQYQNPAYSSAPRSAGMERPTVFYKYGGVENPGATYEDGNYYPHPLDETPDQSQRAQQPTSIDEPAENDREKRHNAVPHNQNPDDSSGPHSTHMKRPTVFYKYDGAMSPSTGNEEGNYHPHPL